MMTGTEIWAVLTCLTLLLTLSQGHEEKLEYLRESFCSRKCTTNEYCDLLVGDCVDCSNLCHRDFGNVGDCHKYCPGLCKALRVDDEPEFIGMDYHLCWEASSKDLPVGSGDFIDVDADDGTAGTAGTAGQVEELQEPEKSTTIQPILKTKDTSTSAVVVYATLGAVCAVLVMLNFGQCCVILRLRRRGSNKDIEIQGEEMKFIDRRDPDCIYKPTTTRI